MKAPPPAALPGPPARLPRSMLAMAVKGGELSVRAKGQPGGLGQDVYHRLMRLSWPRLLGLFMGVFLGFNLVFAVAYWLDPAGLAVAHEDAGLPPYWRDFFFSVHTVATIGYGNIYPADLYANVIVVIEITLGIVYFALATGMAFARFSRPTARMLFSQVLVVHDVAGVPTLMLRAANQRHNMIYSAEARMAVLLDGEVGGVRMRRFVDLPLVRATNPAFALTWTIMHTIDAASPLHPWLASQAEGMDQDIVVILWGVDEVSGQTIHGRWAYGPGDIRWDARFEDIVDVDEGGIRTIDYTRFHATHRMPA